jgi:hypothetical protein
MNHCSNGNGWHREPATAFDYPSLGEQAAEDVDAEYWQAASELFNAVLGWLTAGRSLRGTGARVYVLALYLGRPEMINKNSLREIASLQGAPDTAALSKAMLEFQRRYNLKVSYYQKAPWMRERYRRAALAAHREQ